ncbi:FAD-binding oxidoreductase [Terrabacter terrae]|uniref:FAD-binding oxidoreductase n=1 Tax=Terrabacter terrae TaxID=318434 RepID=A0ABN2U2Y2_9MICO
MAVQTSLRHRTPYRGSHTVTRVVGPASIAALVTAFAALWAATRPGGDVGPFVGQLLGAEGVLLMSVGLVLISTLRWVEQFFDGVDKAAVWHRRVAIAGTALVGVHIATTGNRHPTHLGPTLGTIGIVGLATLTVWAIAPRWRSLTPRRLRRPVECLMETSAVQVVGRWVGSYGLWRGFHRLTGIFLAFGFVHGVMDSTVFGSQLLRWSYLVVGGVGIAFYLYRELLARHFAHTHDYEVSSVEPIGDASFEIWLRPLGERFAFRPGQFALVNLEARDGWHRHPFTIASGPQEKEVRITVRALGDFTSSIGELVAPGMPAVISSPQGHFDYTRGTEHQVWVAGGIGVAPMLSWLRSAQPGGLPHRVDFFYSARGPAPLADEVAHLAGHHDELRLHLVDTRTDPRLTAEGVLDRVGVEPRAVSAFLCGPEAMVNALQRDLVRAGVKPANVHREFYNLR